MELNPCPNCGAPKHPLKVCPQCGSSNLRREIKEQLSKELEENGKEPVVAKYAVGYLGRKRVKPPHRYDVWNEDSEMEPYQGAFYEDLLASDTPPLPLSPSSCFQPRPASPADLAPFNAIHSRLATRHQKAARWLVEKPAAQLPMKRIWDVEVFDGWPCPSTTTFAKELIKVNPQASLRDLQLEIMERVAKEALPHPYIWRIRVGICRSKELFMDVQGQPYVSIDGIWRLAYSIRHMGGLVGAKGLENTRYAKVPHQGYFVCWENEDEERVHYLNSHYG